MSTLTLESVIFNEIITEFSQKASGTVIWRDCSNWLNEQRTFGALRNYAPSWFSMLIMHTSSQELLELASHDHRQDIRYSVAKNPSTPRYLLEMLAGGTSELVKEAALGRLSEKLARAENAHPFDLALQGGGELRRAQRLQPTTLHSATTVTTPLSTRLDRLPTTRPT